MKNSLYTYFVRYSKIPIILISPYLFFILLEEIIFSFIRYDFLVENKHFFNLLNYNENLLIYYLELISIEFYYRIQEVLPSGISNYLLEVLPTLSKNFLFNIGLVYLIYCSSFITLIIIIINIEIKPIYIFIKKIILIEEFKNKINDKNGDFFRNLRNIDIRIPALSLELKLLFTDINMINIMQYSLFLSFSFCIIPYLSHEYVFFIGKYVTLPFIVIGIDFYINTFITYILLQLTLLSILVACGLILIFSKRNIIILVFRGFIVKNFVLLHNIEIEKNINNTYTSSRLNTFNDSKLKEMFYKEISIMNINKK
ncbi:hypothetical protein [Aliarcobacter butzleri]|uniref:hypothetical protein n=1 Tax=Aliarcobacter butzleri TaxID=28197 RepID=UPI003ACED84A